MLGPGPRGRLAVRVGPQAGLLGLELLEEALQRVQEGAQEALAADLEVLQPALGGPLLLARLLDDLLRPRLRLLYAEVRFALGLGARLLAQLLGRQQRVVEGLLPLLESTELLLENADPLAQAPLLGQQAPSRSAASSRKASTCSGS